MEIHMPCLNISKLKNQGEPRFVPSCNHDITFWKAKFEFRILRVWSVLQCGVTDGHPVV